MNADTSMYATESVAVLAAMEALGHLFKITEVFLWDDAMVSAPVASVHLDNFVEESTTCTSADVNSSINHVIDDYRYAEDIQLAKDMDALGLPVSFCTTKQKNSIAVKAKRKGLWPKSVSANNDSENRVPGASRNCILEDNSSLRILQDSTNIPLCSKATEGDIESSFQDSYEDRYRSVLQSDRESSSVAAAILGHTDEKQHGNNGSHVIITNCAEDELSPSNVDVKMSAEDLEHARSSYPDIFLGNDMKDVKSGAHQEELFHKDVVDNYVEGSCITCVTGENKDDDGIKNLDSYRTSMESSLPCASADHVLDYPDSCSELGDWRVVWDPFYKRNYFCNIQSQESTWYPPPGLEHFAFCSTVSNSNELSTDTAEEHTGIEFACDVIHDIDFYGSHDGASSFQEKEVDFEYLNHLSEGLVSTRMNDDLTEDFGYAESDEHVIVTKIADERVSLHMPMDHSADELVVNEYGRKLEKQMTSEEACSAPDLPHEPLIGNRLNATGDRSSSSTSLISSMDDLDSYNESDSKKKIKKRVKRRQTKFPLQDGGLPPSTVKYWCQRYLLFAQFDNGVKMDEEGWFSVTPESLARHHASRCGSGVIIDCFTGVGGNAIQFAMKSNHVMAIDIDPQKIDYAQHNASIYGVSDRINFIKGDFFQIAPHLKGDVIFMSPPWGGPDYSKVQSYDIRTMLKPHGGQYLFEVARGISSRVVMFLPRNVDLHQLAELSLSVNPPWALEVEKNFLNGKLKAITAYFDNPML